MLARHARLIRKRARIVTGQFTKDFLLTAGNVDLHPAHDVRSRTQDHVGTRMFEHEGGAVLGHRGMDDGWEMASRLAGLTQVPGLAGLGRVPLCEARLTSVANGKQ